MREETRVLKDGREITLFFDEDRQAYLITGELMDMAIEGLEEEQKRRWISCSDRLPEDLEDVLVWVVGVFKNGVHVGEECQWYGIGYRLCANWNVLCNKDIKDIKVMAWMPLPEPYKGE